MSLQERISAQSKIDNALLIQNDRIGKASQIQENKVLSFKPVDEELLREYNEQFPKSFEYIDNTGQKKFRKFMIPQDAPALHVPVVQPVMDDATYQNVLNDENTIVGEILNLEQDLQTLEQQLEKVKQTPLTKKFTKTKMKNAIIQITHNQHNVQKEIKGSNCNQIQAQGLQVISQLEPTQSKESDSTAQWQQILNPNLRNPL